MSPVSADSQDILETNTEFNSADENKSIKELHEDIKDLKLRKQNILSLWDSFSSNDGKLRDFIKDDVTEQELSEIEWFVKIFIHRKQQIELNNNLSDINAELVKNKLDFFKSLTGYVKPEKLRDYLEYIKWNIELVKENQEIKDVIIKKEELLDKKVEIIKEKIESNNKLLSDKIVQLVNIKIDEKVSAILKNPRFIALNEVQKKLVFETTLKKIIEKRVWLQNIHDQTSLLQQKIEIFKVIETKLSQFINLY